ncbi:hypothetical protein SE17_11150 [Kouleothrix aurantiaca]|uniref:Uncharacterized protein n=1 Tax=Kouleothrix aurantiaca TaxID=186479 RepID=A0A0P9D2F3_9CHLR|nr:hypothetical protein SE17_11150 [Kouleothrix aurantiaca]
MNTTTSAWGRLEPPRARRIHITLTSTEHEINRILTYGYGAEVTVECYELAEEAREYRGSLGPKVRPAQYRLVCVAAFPAHAQSENAAEALCGFVRGLGGTAEED